MTLSFATLPIEKNVYLGPRHQDFCNRYFRRQDGTVEVQAIYRYAKPGKTRIMTQEEFDLFLLKSRQN